ncbi:hypothetical protein F4780DRAFT_518262 [Xylariomycetidae sp. FL0641]|nr:hypothetical protein F4780DRAFT_518262 [Xylariomycetidae sp. FL0641]
MTDEPAKDPPSPLPPPQRSRKVPKLGHKKSMFGCKRCRARRVKCNEAKPVCHNCERHHTPCVYDRNAFSQGLHVSSVTPKASTSPSSNGDQGQGQEDHPQPPPPSYAAAAAAAAAPDPGPSSGYTGLAGGLERDDPPESRERRLLEARLMHQFVTQTGDSLCIDEWSKQIMVTTTAELCFTCDALMYAMYSVAAQDLARQDAEGRAGYWQGAADKYWSMALREHQRDIGTISRGTTDVVCLSSSLIRVVAWMRMRGRPRQPYYTPPSDVLAMMRASSFTFQEAWRLVGIDHGSVAFQMLKGTRYIHDPEKMPRRAGFRRLEYLLHRSAQHALVEHWDGEVEEAYTTALSYLGTALDIYRKEGPAPRFLRMLFLSPMLMQRRFVDLLQARAPRALAVLAHNFGMLELCDTRRYWWIGSLGADEVRAIAAALPPEWQGLVAWPLRMVETGAL